MEIFFISCIALVVVLGIVAIGGVIFGDNTGPYGHSITSLWDSIKPEDEPGAED